MKRTLFLIIFLLLVINLKSYGYSEKFKLMVDTIELDYQNINGKMLNEDVFNTYSLFVYGYPNENYVGQRWKNVEDGNWIYGQKTNAGDGTRGEYWILGENAQGYLVHNHKFPVDIEPPTPPTDWKYAVLNDALISWSDQSKYMDDLQKEYMLNAKLERNGNEYNITAKDIGLEKVRLENYATWKTKGTVYTQRYDKDGKKWAANFMVKPMAADSSIDGFATFENGMKIYLTQEDSKVVIPINYGANVINISEYAKAEHVKEIKSELYLEKELLASTQKEKSLSVSDSLEYIYERKNGENKAILNFSVESILLTKYTTDGALTDVKNYEVIIYFGDEVIEDDYLEDDTYYNHVLNERYSEYEEILPPQIKSIVVKKYEKNELQDLPINNVTNTKFICAGQTIMIETVVSNFPDDTTLSFDGDSSIFTFDRLTKNFEWYEPKSRNIKPLYSSLDSFEKMYKRVIKIEDEEFVGEDKKYKLIYVIPYNTKQTLHSWSTLRKLSNDALNIDEKRLFTRITEPYEIVIKAKNNVGADTKRVSIDVFERWDTLYNRDISKYIVGDKNVKI